MTEKCKLCQEITEIKERGLCKECCVYSDEQITKHGLLDEIEDMKNDLSNKNEAFLRLFGWDDSCDFPDSCWRWVKIIKSQTIAVSCSNAINIEKQIFHYRK